MQKHHGEEWKQIGGGQIAVAGRKDLGIARRNQRELPQEQFKLVGAQAVLEQKHQAIDGIQYPGNHWWVAGRDSVPDRDHLRLFDSMSRIADNIWRFQLRAEGSC